MGLLEFHFHDADFDFSPSMNRGGSSDDRPSVESTDWESDDDSGGIGKGAIVALLVLVAIGAVVGMRRRRSGGEADEGDEEIQIRE